MYYRTFTLYTGFISNFSRRATGFTGRQKTFPLHVDGQTRWTKSPLEPVSVLPTRWPLWNLQFTDCSKVNSDHHHSKFSNLSNWKEEAWKTQGFNGIRTCVLRVTSSRRSQVWTPLIWSPDFFRLLLSSCSCLNWKIYCDDHSSLSSITAVHIWIISYKLHITDCLYMYIIYSVTVPKKCVL